MAANQLSDPGFLSGQMNFHSFLDALYGASLSSEFPDLRTSSHLGLLSLWISEAEIYALAKPFKFALVGKVPSRSPILEAIHKFFFNLKLIGECSVTILDLRHVLTKMVNDLDYSRIFLVIPPLFQTVL